MPWLEPKSQLAHCQPAGCSASVPFCRVSCTLHYFNACRAMVTYYSYLRNSKNWVHTLKGAPTEKVCLGLHRTECASLLNCCGHSASGPMSSSIQQHVQVGTWLPPPSAWENEPHYDATLRPSCPEDPFGAPATSRMSARLHKRLSVTHARFTRLDGTIRSTMLNCVFFVQQSYTFISVAEFVYQRG
ncbi:uncharacterized protein LOC119176489 isoform X3 [Rhipicephalus microplus]|uniref:uncharacterized protein LOC119176489 isoform X3 n=1 Tax=Rhipicephalus microplus TaxID=6941 RepID=UPI003F6C0FB0